MTPPRDETALIERLREIAGSEEGDGFTWACVDTKLMKAAAEALDAASRDTVRAARAYNKSLDNLGARLRVVEQESQSWRRLLEHMTEERDQAIELRRVVEQERDALQAELQVRQHPVVHVTSMSEHGSSCWEKGMRDRMTGRTD